MQDRVLHHEPAAHHALQPKGVPVQYGECVQVPDGHDQVSGFEVRACGVVSQRVDGIDVRRVTRVHTEQKRGIGGLEYGIEHGGLSQQPPGRVDYVQEIVTPLRT